MDKDIACRLLFGFMLGMGIILGTMIFKIGVLLFVTGVIGLLICDHLPNINYYMAKDLVRKIEAYTKSKSQEDLMELQWEFRTSLGWILKFNEKGDIIDVCR